MASLNIMAKTFAKIAKIVCWIISNDCCNKKKTYPYSSFRSKICENEIYTKNWVKSTWSAKSQSQQSTVRSTKSTVMMQAGD